MNRSTLFEIIERFESGNSAKHHARDGGRPDNIFNQTDKKELGWLVNNKDAFSQRKLASRLRCVTKESKNKMLQEAEDFGQS